MSSSKLKPYAGDNRKLYACIDIGTTFSGISYCIAEPGAVPEVLGVTRFPGQELVGGNAKIPSVLFYDEDGVVQAAGAETLLDEMGENVAIGEWTKAEWFKLHLAPKYDGSPAEVHKLPPLPLGKSVHDVFTDFLKHLLACLQSFIQDSSPAGDALWAQLAPTAEYTLTHPNAWGGPQQQEMRQMAIDAGLVKDAAEARKRVHFVTEGEAGLHFCGHHGLATESMQDGNGLILLDAGGGTVDLSAYAANGKTSGGTFSEVAASKCTIAPIGIFQGSTFVTSRAREYFESTATFKGSKWEADVDHMTNTFDKHTKLTIKNNTDTASVKFGSASATDPKLKVRLGTHKIPGATAAGFFKPSIDAIYAAVLEQMAVVQGRGKRVTSVYIVGGFGASPLLFAQLKELLGKLGINVCRPDTHVNKAVADGGVLFLLKGSVTTRVSRYTYGVDCCTPYNPDLSEHRRRKDSSYICELSGERYLPNAFACVLPVNTQVTQEQEFRYTLYRDSREPPTLIRGATLRIYRGTGGIPDWVDVDEDLCYIEGDEHTKPRATQEEGRDGRTYWTLEFDVVLLFGLTELQAQLAWPDENLIQCARRAKRKGN
ncbi:hypothetical protein EV122DRAFT_293372 [Schizophyllum commune]